MWKHVYVLLSAGSRNISIAAHLINKSYSTFLQIAAFLQIAVHVSTLTAIFADSGVFADSGL